MARWQQRLRIEAYRRLRLPSRQQGPQRRHRLQPASMPSMPAAESVVQDEPESSSNESSQEDASSQVESRPVSQTSSVRSWSPAQSCASEDQSSSYVSTSGIFFAKKKSRFCPFL